MGTLKDLFDCDAFENMLGAKVVEAQEGYAKVGMTVKPCHLNLAGICHGGVIFALADMAFGVAANSRGKLTVSLNAGITFLKPAYPGPLFAEAREIMNHGKVPFLEVRVTDGEQNLIALMTSSGYRKREELEVDGIM